MGDEEPKSNRQRFLSRIRSKSTSKDSNVTAGQTQQLKQDVVDFLKPSTERAALVRPRIDVAIAQRWPEANTVDNATAPTQYGLQSQDIKQMRRRRRKEGLAVGFVATVPEIIGEGGDECPYATIEISRMKSRSARPGMLPQRRSVGQAASYSISGHGTPPQLREENPRELRWANTHGDHLTTRSIVEPQQRLSTYDQRGLNDSPVSTNHDRKRSIMAVNEGMALKRASSIPDEFDDNDNEHDDNDPPAHFGPGSTRDLQGPSSMNVPNYGGTNTTSHISMDPSLRSAVSNGVVMSHSAASTTVTPLSGGSRRQPGKVNNSPFVDPKYSERSNGVKAARPQPGVAQLYPGQAQYASPKASNGAFDPPLDGPTVAGAQNEDAQYVAYAAPGKQAVLNIASTTARADAVEPNAPGHELTRQQTAPSRHRTQTLDPESAHSANYSHPYSRSGQPSQTSPSIGEAALTDFATRVAHMKGVFSLTAEKERPSDRCTPALWLRSAYWWFLMGKMDLEAELRQRTQSRNAASRELLLQGHVHVAKTWWILSFPLSAYATAKESYIDSPASQLHADYAELRNSLQALCLSLGRNGLMPPPASLIQGQDTTVWNVSPPSITGSYLKDLPLITPASSLSIGDTSTQFYYSRFSVDIAFESTEGTDRSTIAGILTVVRSRNAYQTDITIATQDETISLRVGVDDPSRASIAWQGVSWTPSMSAISIQLPDSTVLHVRLHGNDYKMLGNLVEYSRNATRMMQPRQTETLGLNLQLSSLLYTSKTSSSAFPRGPVEHCRVLVFATPSAAYRIVLVTDVDVKILSSASHINDRHASITEHDGPDLTTTLEFRDERRASAATLTFGTAADKDAFRAMIRNPAASPSANIPLAELDRRPSALHGKVRLRVPLVDYRVQDLVRPTTPEQTSPLQWHTLMVADAGPSDASQAGEQLSIIMMHRGGQFDDELDSVGLSFCLPRMTNDFTITVSREPQPSFNGSVQKELSSSTISTVTTSMIQTARDWWTVRTLQFPTLAALHDFETAVTGYVVRFDGTAASFAISRSTMMVSLHHKWMAHDVRIQIVSNKNGSVVKLLAFMQGGFEHADAMCFEVKSTDVFERIKGDSKGKKWAIKLVDAKFSLPRPGKAEDEAVMRMQRQFINIDDPQYAEEHDDITVGFDSEQYRDLFAQALPAVPTVAKMLTLRRRI